MNKEILEQIAEELNSAPELNLSESPWHIKEHNDQKLELICMTTYTSTTRLKCIHRILDNYDMEISIFHYIDCFKIRAFLKK